VRTARARHLASQQEATVAIANAMTLTERLRHRSLWKTLRSEFASDLVRLEEQLRASAMDSRAPVPDAVLNLLQAGGKRVRPLLAWLACNAVGARSELADPVAVAAELTHAATLLHDDVLDEGEQRRGVPASRILYGNRISILGGDFLLTRVLEALLRTGDQSLMHSYRIMLQKAVEGEVIQHESRFDVNVSEAVYREIVELKTAALFTWTAEAGAVIGGADPQTTAALAAFGRGMGIAFQILDDWLDWVGEGSIVGKAVRSDLKEGKPSLAVIYGCQMEPEIRAWFRTHVRDDAPEPGADEIARLAGKLAACGAIGRVRRKLEEETAAAVRRLEILPSTAARDRLVRFAQLLVARDR
jgi:octaprenyl-diphosphate synthase